MMTSHVSRWVSTRIRSVASLCALALLLSAAPAFAVPIQYGSTDTYFELFDVGTSSYPFTWGQANALAQTQSFGGAQGHLATPKDSATDNFLRTTFDVFNPANPANSAQNCCVFGPYIGLFWDGSGSKLDKTNYQWVDGQSWVASGSYNGWRSGEPSGDGNPGVNYLLAGGAAGWNDEGYTFGTHAYIVQYDNAVPEPGTLTLMLGGAAALFARARRRSK